MQQKGYVGMLWSLSLLVIKINRNFNKMLVQREKKHFHILNHGFKKMKTLS